MRNWVSILLIFVCLFSYAQEEDYEQVEEVSKSQVEDYILWACEKEGYWGSFWWKVTRHKEGENYYYNVYVYSNSYFNVKDYSGNYRKAITKISDCFVWVEDSEEAVDFDAWVIKDKDDWDEWRRETFKPNDETTDKNENAIGILLDRTDSRGSSTGSVGRHSMGVTNTPPVLLLE